VIYLAPFAVLAVLAGILLWWAGERRPGRATALAWLLLAVSYIAATEPLGHPKPMRIEVFRALDGITVDYYAASDGDILIVSGRRSYTLPYSEQLVRQLAEAMGRAEAEGGTARLRTGFDGTEGGEPSAEWVPLPPEPPKKG
jgi:hypothetical protein